MPSSLLIVLAVWLAGHGLRTFQSPLLRRLGALCWLGATWLAGWFLSGGSHVAAAAAVGIWFALPWVEIILRVRPLRLPAERSLVHRHPPSRDDFPQLAPLTSELQDAGFEQCADTGWTADGVSQFLRLFYRESDQLQAAICWNEQRGMAIAHLSLTTRFPDGRQFVTSDFPFSASMIPAPSVFINQQAESPSLAALIESHQTFLDCAEPSGGVDAEPLDPETLPERISAELAGQLRHNVDAGILSPADDGHVRYSWRGCFFLWRQYLRDLIRMA